MMKGLEILVMEDSQLGNKLLLLLEHVADNLLPVVDILGEDLLRHDPGAGLLGLGVLVHLLDIVTREPTRLPVKSPLPPAAVLTLSDGDQITFLEFKLQKNLCRETKLKIA